tara:strand:+ start:232 stop:441 length:210 start_codon:yes stop_codon:yes gene_type:complete
MSILNKLQNQGSILSVNNGSTPSTPNFAQSEVHNQYSINGNPNINGKPQPSILDLDGVTPPKYSDNLPR